MKRNLALERAIVEAPDEIGGFLVYADWLQQEGDPRGELIALQCANQPTENYILRHPGLEPVDPSIRVTWRRGFWYSVRAPHEKLPYVLEHPSAVALRDLGITIREPTGFAVAEAMLRRGPRPPLRFFSINGSASVPPPIATLFPDLGRTSSWDDLVEQQLAPLDAYDGADALPDLEPVIDRAILARVVTAVRGELSWRNAIGIVAAMRVRFTPASRDRFAVAFVHRWIASNRRNSDAWMLNLSAAIGGDECAAALGEAAVRHVGYPVDSLAAMDTPAARAELLGRSYTSPRRRGQQPPTPEALLVGCPRTAIPAARERLVAWQLRWFDDLIVHGRRIPKAAFVEHVATHPIRAPLAATLVWRQGDRLFDLASTIGDGDVTCVHPLELSDADRVAWNDKFRGLAKPVPQIRRPTFGAPIRTGFVVAVPLPLEDLGWTQVENMRTLQFTRRFERGPVTIGVRLTPRGFRLTDVNAVDGDGRAVSLDDLDPIVASEVNYDFSRAARP